MLLELTRTREVAETKLDMPLRQARDAQVARHVANFDAKLKERALEHLASVASASKAVEATFDDLEAPAWSALREAIDLDQQLLAKEKALEAQFRSAVSSLPPGGFAAGPAYEKTREGMELIGDALKETRRARFELRAATPAMAFVDSKTIDLSKNNAELANTLHEGAGELRANIDDVAKRIESGDIDLRKLDRLVKQELEKVSAPEQLKAVAADLEIEAENEALIKYGTLAASLCLTVGTLGTGSLALGALGAGFSFGTAAIDFELAADLNDVGRASLTDHDALIDAAAAHERYASATAHLVLASVDLVLSGVAAREAMRVSKLVRTLRHAPADYVPQTGPRNTLGRSGTPTATPHPSQPHLAAIHKGLETMPKHIRQRLDHLLQGGDEGRRLRGEMDKLEAQLQVLMVERAALSKRPGTAANLAKVDAKAQQISEQGAKLETQLVPAESAGQAKAAELMGHFLKSIRRPVDAQKLAAQVKIEKSAVNKVAADLELSPAEAEAKMRTWLANYLRIADPRVEPSALRIFWDSNAGARASYSHGTGIHVGDQFSESTMFHEISHAVEHVDATVSRTTKSWRDARASGVDSSLRTESLSKLDGSLGYRSSEKALARHDFHHDYVAKVYGDNDPSTEVLTMAAQALNRSDDALGLYRVDPELFYLALGLLRGP